MGMAGSCAPTGRPGSTKKPAPRTGAAGRPVPTASAGVAARHDNVSSRGKTERTRGMSQVSAPTPLSLPLTK
ncbi:MAG: hypothetical protein NVSMB55_26390 [Mycobacteriales bacterium]